MCSGLVECVQAPSSTAASRGDGLHMGKSSSKPQPDDESEELHGEGQPASEGNGESGSHDDLLTVTKQEIAHDTCAEVANSLDQNNLERDGVCEAVVSGATKHKATATELESTSDDDSIEVDEQHKKPVEARASAEETFLHSTRNENRAEVLSPPTLAEIMGTALQSATEGGGSTPGGAVEALADTGASTLDKNELGVRKTQDTLMEYERMHKRQKVSPEGCSEEGGCPVVAPAQNDKSVEPCQHKEVKMTPVLEQENLLPLHTIQEPLAVDDWTLFNTNFETIDKQPSKVAEVVDLDESRVVTPPQRVTRSSARRSGVSAAEDEDMNLLPCIWEGISRYLAAGLVTLKNEGEVIQVTEDVGGYQCSDNHSNNSEGQSSPNQAESNDAERATHSDENCAATNPRPILNTGKHTDSDWGNDMHNLRDRHAQLQTGDTRLSTRTDREAEYFNLQNEQEVILHVEFPPGPRDGARRQRSLPRGRDPTARADENGSSARNTRRKRRMVLTMGDERKLDQRQFLNDNIINFYLRYLQSAMEWKTLVSDGSGERKETRALRVHVFNSFFYSKLKSAVCEARDFGRVARWTKDLNIFELDLMLIPINEGLHWSLAVICNPGSLVASSGEEGKPMHNDEGAIVLDISSDEEVEILPGRAARPVSGPSRMDSMNGKSRETKRLNSRFADLSTTSVKGVVGKTTVSDVKQRDFAVQSTRSTETTQMRVRVDDGSESHAHSGGKHRAEALKLSIGPSNGIDNEKNSSIEPCILVLDSLRCHQEHEIAMVLRRYLELEHERRLGTSTNTTAKMFPLVQPEVPRQTNSCDCGVFLLLYAELVLRNTIHSLSEGASVASSFRKPFLKFSLPEVNEMREVVRTLIWAMKGD